MTPEINQSPFHAMPPVVVALAAVMFGLECLFALAEANLIGGADAVGWRLLAIQDYGFSAPVFDWMLQNQRFPPHQLMRFVTFPFLHADFTHALFVSVFVLAMGKAISGLFTPLRFLLLFFGSGVFGALIYGFTVTSQSALIGGFPGTYGLIGAYTFLLWMQARALGEAPLRAFSLIGILAAVQLIFAIFFGSGPQWIAELSGFGFGFLVSFVLVPGGWAHLRSWLRHR